MELTSLLSVVVGGVIGVAGSLIPHVWERRRARASARATARAYIVGILEMERVRNHAQLYRAALDSIRSGASQSLPRIYGAEEQPVVDEMQKALIGQLGSLGPDEASDLVLFCNMLVGLRVDLKPMALGKMDQLTIQQKITVLENDLRLWEDTQQLGRKLIQRLG